MKAAQSGGSEALHNILGYFIQYDPSPMLFVHPTAMVAEEWSKERLADMLRSTPALRAVVRDRRQPRKSHEAESTLSLKIFPGGYLALGGANTPNTFARRSVRFAFADDFARFPYVVREEGDPGDLLVNRTTTFHDGLSMFVSTPALKGDRIDTLFSRSDRRRYHVACPHCGREDWLTWREPDHFRVTYDGDNPETARLECPSEEHGGCGARMDEPERRRMIAKAGARPDSGWRATAEPQESGLVGFHLPAMVSTLGVTLSGLVEQWLSARARGNESLRVFINTVLGEGWELRGTRVDAHTLLDRRESYGNEAEEPDGERVEVPVEAPVGAELLAAASDLGEAVPTLLAVLFELAPIDALAPAVGTHALGFPPAVLGLHRRAKPDAFADVDAQVLELATDGVLAMVARKVDALDVKARHEPEHEAKLLRARLEQRRLVVRAGNDAVVFVLGERAFHEPLDLHRQGVRVHNRASRDVWLWARGARGDVPRPCRGKRYDRTGQGT